MGSGKYQRLVATTAPASGGVNQRFCSGSEAPPGGPSLVGPRIVLFACKPRGRFIGLKTNRKRFVQALFVYQ